MSQTRTSRTYDHRLIRLVQQTGDAPIATRMGVPRSTVSGWLHRGPRVVVGANGAEESTEELQARVVRLERRLHRLLAMLRIVVALVRIIQPDLRSMRVQEGDNKQRLLRAIERSRVYWGYSAGCSADLLIKAGAHLESAAEPPTLPVDGGVENYTKDVDAVVESACSPGS